jgi:hypothetical protein
MMSQQRETRVLTFKKIEGHKELVCRIRIYNDGSAYVDSDEMEAIFEESPAPFEEALSYVRTRGYVQVDC